MTDQKQNNLKNRLVCYLAHWYKFLRKRFLEIMIDGGIKLEEKIQSVIYFSYRESSLGTTGNTSNQPSLCYGHRCFIWITDIGLVTVHMKYSICFCKAEFIFLVDHYFIDNLDFCTYSITVISGYTSVENAEQLLSSCSWQAHIPLAPSVA